MTKEKYTTVAKCDDLKSCLREMSAHAQMLMTKRVKERISWTQSDSELAKRQRADSAIKMIVWVIERYDVNLGRFPLYLWKEPDLQGGSPILGELRSIRTLE